MIIPILDLKIKKNESVHQNVSQLMCRWTWLQGKDPNIYVWGMKFNFDQNEDSAEGEAGRSQNQEGHPVPANKSKNTKQGPKQTNKQQQVSG